MMLQTGLPNRAKPKIILFFLQNHFVLKMVWQTILRFSTGSSLKMVLFLRAKPFRVCKTISSLNWFCKKKTVQSSVLHGLANQFATSNWFDPQKVQYKLRPNSETTKMVSSKLVSVQSRSCSFWVLSKTSFAAKPFRLQGQTDLCPKSPVQTPALVLIVLYLALYLLCIWTWA